MFCVFGFQSRWWCFLLAIVDIQNKNVHSSLSRFHSWNWSVVCPRLHAFELTRQHRAKEYTNSCLCMPLIQMQIGLASLWALQCRFVLLVRVVSGWLPFTMTALEDGSFEYEWGTWRLLSLLEEPSVPRIQVPSVSESCSSTHHHPQPPHPSKNVTAWVMIFSYNDIIP